MPAVVSSTVGSLDTSDEDGATVWPRSAKNFKKLARMSSERMGLAVDMYSEFIAQVKFVLTPDTREIALRLLTLPLAQEILDH